MNRILQTGTMLVFSFLLFSCSGENKEEAKTEENEEVKSEVIVENCLYTYNADSSSLNWTAFKTTDRVGVNGSFKTVKVTLADSVTSIKEAIETVSFELDINSIFTNNPERDETLRKYFFASLENGGEIFGEVKIVEGDELSGGGSVKISINNISRDIGFKYETKDNVIMLRTRINLDSFDGQKATETLNSQCGELHAGSDGVSKMWPDIEIEIKAVLNKEC